jgi:AAA15 family ATPase/GTPase
MLIRFVVSNFMSFKEETEFNMLKSNGNGSRQFPNHVIKTDSGVEILKTAAIYGANAAGKSNLIKAIEYLKNTVLNTNNTHLVPQSKRFRIDESYKSKSSTFRLEYLFNNIHFDYALEIEKGKIIQEWLYIIDSVKKEKEQFLYERKLNEVSLGSFFEGNDIDINYLNKYLNKELQPTQTVLNALNDRIEGTEIINSIYCAFLSLKIVTPQSLSVGYIESLINNKHSKEFIEKVLQNSNTGIERLEVQDIEADNFFSYEDANFKSELIELLESELEKANDRESIPFIIGNQLATIRKEGTKYLVSIIKTKHYASDNLFDFDEESDGTNRLFELIPAFEELIENDDSVYLIDEIERSLHPILAKELLKLFTQNSLTKSQLIFTTHESHLLDDDLFRRDEIWFTEKKPDGSTVFYPLSNFNPRGDKVIERGYLQGRYGGIPFLGDFSKLLMEEKLL